MQKTLPLDIIGIIYQKYMSTYVIPLLNKSEERERIRQHSILRVEVTDSEYWHPRMCCHISCDNLIVNQLVDYLTNNLYRKFTKVLLWAPWYQSRDIDFSVAQPRNPLGTPALYVFVGLNHAQVYTKLIRSLVLNGVFYKHAVLMINCTPDFVQKRYTIDDYLVASRIHDCVKFVKVFDW
jgi:hypothetical protein